MRFGENNPTIAADSPEARAEVLAKRGDVRALQALIRSVTGKREASSTEGDERLRKLEALLIEAQKRRLELDHQAFLKQSSR